MVNIIKNTLQEAAHVLELFMADEVQCQRIEQAAERMAEALRGGKKIMACGNGGSMCDATHFAEELSARFRRNRRALPALAINDPAYMSCVVNDFGADYVFSRFVEAFGQQGDILLAISTSGNSENIMQAVSAAHGCGMEVVALTGKGGGRLAGAAQIEIRAPKTEFSDRAQEIHIKVIHLLVQLIECKLDLDK